MTILLMILKGVGLFLLALLLLILVLLAFILFVPLLYQVSVKKEEEGRPDGKATLRVLLLFRLEAAFGVENSVGLFLCGKKLWPRERKEKPPKKPSREKPQAGDASLLQERRKRAAIETDRVVEPKPGRPHQAVLGKEKRPAGDNRQNKQKRRRPKEPQKQAHGQEAQQSGIKKAKSLAARANELRLSYATAENKAAVIAVLKAAKRLLKHLFPRRASGRIVFGFADPALTGEVLGAFSVLYAASKGAFLAEADFTREVFAGEAELSGHVFPISFLAFLLRLLFNRHVRTLYRRLRKPSASEEEAM